MTDRVDNVHHLAERQPEASVRDRIQRRKEVLQEWLINGVPQSVLPTLPASLRQARDWEDESIGIHKIGSPNDFTTKHSVHGRDVAEIARLLTQLRERYKRPRRRRPPDQGAASSSTPDTLPLTQAISQWHAARSAYLAEKARVDALEAKVASLQQEAQEREVELADLRRQLAETKVGLRAVK